MAPSSKRSENSRSRSTGGASRRAKKTDAAAIRDVADESAAIYPDTFETPPSPDEIAVEAYYIYCERGLEQGCDIDHWLEAERRLGERRMSRPAGDRR